LSRGSSAASRALQAAQQFPAERLARVIADVDGVPWEKMLPQARAALVEVWRMMDGGPA
jgi:hypothetical protein